MKGNIFKDPTTSIPKQDDPRVQRIDFEVSGIGARKSVTSGAGAKNSMSVQHTTSAATKS